MMSRITRAFLVAMAIACTLPVSPVAAAGSASMCEDGPQASGAVYRICMPEAEAWNGDLVIYAHGYVAFNEPLAIPEDQLLLPDGTSIPEIMNGLGFAFATTSYSTNGLAIREGIADVADLAEIFRLKHGAPRRVYLGGHWLSSASPTSSTAASLSVDQLAAFAGKSTTWVTSGSSSTTSSRA